MSYAMLNFDPDLCSKSAWVRKQHLSLHPLYFIFPHWLSRIDLNSNEISSYQDSWKNNFLPGET